MSDKNLLNENTIRRFMKLANVDTMTDNFISEMGTYKKNEEPEEQKEGVEEEETVEEGAHDKDEEKKMEESNDEDVVEEEFELTTEEEDDMEMDAEMGDMDDGDADISLTEEEAQLLIDLGSRLEAAMGDAGEDDMDDMDDMDDEPIDDMDDEPMDDMDDEEEPAPGMRDSYMQEEIVNEVLKRVTQRIIREKMKRK